MRNWLSGLSWSHLGWGLLAVIAWSELDGIIAGALIGTAIGLIGQTITDWYESR